MAPEKWQRREKKLQKKKQGMRVSGRSVFTLQEILRRKAEQARREKARNQPSSQNE